MSHEDSSSEEDDDWEETTTTLDTTLETQDSIPPRSCYSNSPGGSSNESAAEVGDDQTQLPVEDEDREILEELVPNSANEESSEESVNQELVAIEGEVVGGEHLALVEGCAWSNWRWV